MLTLSLLSDLDEHILADMLSSGRMRVKSFRKGRLLLAEGESHI